MRDIGNIDFDDLREPFKAEDIQWRIIKAGKSQGGKEYAIVAAYVDNRAIQERLDTVVGIPNWESRFTETVKGMICQLSICGVTKSDGADYTNIEPTKGGISDAMKRAGSQWGIGQYLYKLDTQYGTITPNGKHSGSYEIKDDKGKKTGRYAYFKWNPPKLPNWALPKVDNKVDKDPETYLQALDRLIKIELTELTDKTDIGIIVNKLKKDFNVETLTNVEWDRQPEVLRALEAKIKEIKGE